MKKEVHKFDDHNNTIRGMRSLNDTLLATAYVLLVCFYTKLAIEYLSFFLLYWFVVVMIAKRVCMT